MLTPDEVNILMSDAETLASQGVPIEDIRLRINQELGLVQTWARHKTAQAY